ncbi:MAG: response regulator [Bdellovibrionales bacterium]|nr:response regulator [Bdellovibrionales bacterium]
MKNNVLLVSSDKEIIDIGPRVIKDNFDCILTTVSNGLDAFIECQKKEFKFIITDFKLTFMNGAALVTGIRSRENLNMNTCILIFSDTLDEASVNDIGVQKLEFCKKPIDIHQLTQILWHHLG